VSLAWSYHLAQADHAKSLEEEKSAKLGGSTGSWHGLAKTGIGSWHRSSKIGTCSAVLALVAFIILPTFLNSNL